LYHHFDLLLLYFLELAAGPLPFGFHALIFQRLLRAGVFFDIYLLTLRSGCGFGDFHSFGAVFRTFAFGGGNFLDWMGMTHAVNELTGLGRWQALFTLGYAILFF